MDTLDSIRGVVHIVAGEEFHHPVDGFACRVREAMLKQWHKRVSPGCHCTLLELVVVDVSRSFSSQPKLMETSNERIDERAIDVTEDGFDLFLHWRAPLCPSPGYLYHGAVIDYVTI